MSTTPQDARKAEQKASREDLVRYVEELAGPEDAWISLTDAARITRTSEAMTRRWVTSGRLPVKKEPVGVPPRTRLVRMSDVAAIRPIIDPTAAITGEVRKLDLASIPRQQLQIMEDHQRLTKLMQNVLEEARQHEAAALEQVAMRAETAQTTAASYQKRADAQDRLIQTLTTSLQEEREARKTLTEQLAAQQEQMQALRREIDGVKRRKA